jgi:hypothetical protein
MLCSASSLLLEGLSFHIYPKTRDVLWLFLAVLAENLGYRQLNSYWRIKGLIEWMLGRKAKWGEMTRTANWQADN